MSDISLNEPRWSIHPVPSEGMIEIHRVVPVRHLGDGVYACEHSCTLWGDVTTRELTANEIDGYWITSLEELDRLRKIAGDLVDKYRLGIPTPNAAMLRSEPWVMDTFKPYDRPETRRKYGAKQEVQS